MQGDSYAGAEIDLASALGKELQRTVAFVSLKRDDLINALQDGRVDIVMSGMSVTPARRLRAKFCDPYLYNQLRAIFRRADIGLFTSVADIRATTARIGVLTGSTADIWVQNNCPDAQRTALQNRRDAVFWLTDGGKADVYIDDVFALAQIVSENESKLGYLKEPLATEELAWAIAPGDEQLLAQVNQALAHWKSDGTLNTTLDHWMPYLKDYRP